MPSPFPGMNPYLEQSDLWMDFHNSFLVTLRGLLAVQVEPKYYVRIEETLYLHELSADERRPLGRPDVSLHSTPGQIPGGGVATLPPAAPEFVYAPAPVEEERIPCLEVRDASNNKTVTLIELLSPSNKETGPDRDQYWKKVRATLRTSTSLVEIDLLRGGPRLPWDQMATCDYYALVSRYPHRPRVDFWPCRLCQPLPTIPIPLGNGDADVTVDLQQALHLTYDTARYQSFIFRGKPEPPLNPEDAVWAQQFLPAKPA